MVVTSRWTRIGNAFKCGGLAVAAGLMCIPNEAYINEMGTSGLDFDDNLPPTMPSTVNTTKNNCENSSMALGLNPTSMP